MARLIKKVKCIDCKNNGSHIDCADIKCPTYDAVGVHEFTNGVKYVSWREDLDDIILYEDEIRRLAGKLGLHVFDKDYEAEYHAVKLAYQKAIKVTMKQSRQLEDLAKAEKDRDDEAQKAAIAMDALEAIMQDTCTDPRRIAEETLGALAYK